MALSLMAFVKFKFHGINVVKSFAEIVLRKREMYVLGTSFMRKYW